MVSGIANFVSAAATSTGGSSGLIRQSTGTFDGPLRAMRTFRARNAHAINPALEFFETSALTGAGMPAWFAFLRSLVKEHAIA